jgi:hypothetical protein
MYVVVVVIIIIIINTTAATGVSHTLEEVSRDRRKVAS